MTTDIQSGIVFGKYINLDFIWCPACMDRTEHEVRDSKLVCKSCRIRARQEEILNELGYDAEGK